MFFVVLALLGILVKKPLAILRGAFYYFGVSRAVIRPCAQLQLRHRCYDKIMAGLIQRQNCRISAGLISELVYNFVFLSRSRWMRCACSTDKNKIFFTFGIPL
jgi:hypothetical protein